MSSRTSNKRKFPNETYFPCAYCSEEVRGRQHAIQCDRPGCDRWQHRSCETQFSAADYYRMKRGELDVTWYCYRCLTLADPNQEAGITQVSEDFGAQRAEDPESESYPVNLEEGPDADTIVAELTLRDFHIESSFSEPAAFPLPVEPPVVPVLPDVAHLINRSDEVEYEIIDGCSERGETLLCDSYGYS